MLTMKQRAMCERLFSSPSSPPVIKSRPSLLGGVYGFPSVCLGARYLKNSAHLILRGSFHRMPNEELFD